MKTILFPTDGSPTAGAAIEFLEDLARGEKARVLVLSVAEKVDMGGVEDTSIEKALLDYATTIVNKAEKAIKLKGLDVETMVTLGQPENEILRVAKERGVRAIVMGTHGRTGLVRAVLGSVADRVIRHAACPVILIPVIVKD